MVPLDGSKYDLKLRRKKKDKHKDLCEVRHRIQIDILYIYWWLNTL